MIPICIVEVTRVKSKSWFYVKEMEPTPNDTEVLATLASPLPMSQEASGLYGVPEISPGIKAIAIKYEAQYIITGFFPDYAPQLGYRHTVDQEEPMEAGDYNLRTSSGNRVTVMKNGKLDLFANLWSRLHLSQAKNQLEGYFKRLRFTWFGGSVTSIDETSTRIVLSAGYQNPYTSDDNKDFDETPSVTPQAPELDASVYVDKAVIHNEDVPLHIDTRQNTHGDAAPMSFMKDVFTVEKRGHQGDPNDTVYTFETIDRSRGTSTLTTITNSGLSISANSYTIDATQLQARREDVPNWETGIHLGDHMQIDYTKGDVSTVLSFSDDEDSRVKLVSNEDSFIIGKNLELKRDTTKGPYSLTIDEDGSVVLLTPQFNIVSNIDGQVDIDVVKDGTLVLGGKSADVLTTDKNSVLTPSTIFGDPALNYDTFTGLPFKGSSIVAAKAEHASA